MTTPISLNQTVSAYSLVDSGDPIAVLQMIQAAYSQTMQDHVEKSAAAVRALSSHLDRLKSLRTTLGGLEKVDSDANAKLGSDLQSCYALSAEIGSLGFSLSTETRCPMSVLVYDSNNNLKSSIYKPLATGSEFTAAGNLPVSGYNWLGGEIHSTTATNGERTEYHMYKSLTVLTASTASVSALAASIVPREAAVKQQLATEVLRLKASVAVMVESSSDGAARLGKARKEEGKTVDGKQAEKRQAVEAASRKMAAEAQVQNNRQRD